MFLVLKLHQSGGAVCGGTFCSISSPEKHGLNRPELFF